jgi:hypothetical protein
MKMDYIEATSAELLKPILAHLREPDLLTDHPWAVLLPESKEKNRGVQLVDLVTAVFRKMIPSGPPRTGKRLDTRWGIFGILAAQHFAPFCLGTPTPSSLREAWETLDRSILYFVYGQNDGLSEAQQSSYRFAGNEIEPAPNSTLSDWHRRGIEQLAEMVRLEIHRSTVRRIPKPNVRVFAKRVLLTVGLFLVILGTFLGFQTWGIYDRVQAIEQKVEDLESYLTTSPKLEQVPEISSKVHELRAELDSLQNAAQPYLWLAPYLGWIPRRGGDLSQAEDLLAMAQGLVTAADEGLTAVTPAIQATMEQNHPLDVMDLILQLQEVNPQLLNAQVALAQAQAAREQIEVERLSPRLKNLVTKRVDPLFQSIAGVFPMEDALTMIRIAPRLLGSSKAGPQTYLILMQNEDELRPTGGFLTAVGSAVVKDGKLISIKIESSDLVDDMTKPYPSPPWQFKEFMNIEMLLFRDSNWFTDFPTTVSWAEYFYSYTRATSADGVIALDMQVIVQMLELLGPVQVDGVDLPITSENVMEYLRSAEQRRPKGVVQGEWDRKQFIGKLAQPLLEKILQARGQTWTQLAPVLVQLLDEHHILLQFDDEEASKWLERRAWDGAVRIPANSDYLMVVDTNMGYNKSNAVMNTALDYSVDMSNIEKPLGLLNITQTNRSTIEIPCEPFSTGRFIIRPNLKPGEIPELTYNIDECHWGYLRVYTPVGTQLLRSTPQQIPEEFTMLGKPIPARTDDLGSEDIPQAQVFGMMIITPTKQTTVTEFEFTLTGEVVQISESDGLRVYRLKVQKQPGTLGHPFTLNLTLPIGAQIESATIPFSENHGAWTAQLDLNKDLLIEVRIRLE